VIQLKTSVSAVKIDLIRNTYAVLWISANRMQFAARGVSLSVQARWVLATWPRIWAKSCYQSRVATALLRGAKPHVVLQKKGMKL
jgi:hypothetical protein